MYIVQAAIFHIMKVNGNHNWISVDNNLFLCELALEDLKCHAEVM